MKLSPLTLAAALVLLSVSGLSAQNQDSVKTYLGTAGRLMMDNRFKEAFPLYERVLQLDSLNADALKNIGVIYSAVGNQVGAEEYLKRALAIRPDDPQLYNNLGTIYSETGRLEEALTYHKKAVALDGTETLYRGNLGLAYTKLGQVDIARPILSHVWRQDSSSAAVAFALGSCFAQLKMNDSAVWFYDKAIALGGDTWDLHYFRGIVQRNRENWVEAEKSFQAALKVRPTHLETLQALGSLFMTQQRYPEAHEYFDRALDSDSTYQPALIGLGVASHMSGDTTSTALILKRLFAADSMQGYRMLRLIQLEEAKYIKK